MFCTLRGGKTTAGSDAPWGFSCLLTGGEEEEEEEAGLAAQGDSNLLERYYTSTRVHNHLECNYVQL